MSEIEVLFHNPESLSDRDLSSVRTKMRMYKLIQLSGLGAGIGLGLMRSRKPIIVAPLAIAGGLVGNALGRIYITNTPWVLSESQDKPITNAFINRYLVRSYNMCGYGDSSLTAAEHTSRPNASYKKPY